MAAFPRDGLECWTVTEKPSRCEGLSRHLICTGFSWHAKCPRVRIPSPPKSGELAGGIPSLDLERRLLSDGPRKRCACNQSPYIWKETSLVIKRQLATVPRSPRAVKRTPLGNPLTPRVTARNLRPLPGPALREWWRGLGPHQKFTQSQTKEAHGSYLQSIPPPLPSFPSMQKGRDGQSLCSRSGAASSIA